MYVSFSLVMREPYSGSNISNLSYLLAHSLSQSSTLYTTFSYTNTLRSVDLEPITLFPALC